MSLHRKRDLVDLLEELFEIDWATYTGNRKEATLHRRIARVLLDHGRLGKNWEEWLVKYGA